MINREELIIESKLGGIVSNMLLTHSEGTKNLAVLFPGGDNSTDVPTLHYARKAALLSGCDTLSIEYGYQIGYSELDRQDIMSSVVDECYDVISKCLERGYSKMFFISKSIGHFVAFRLDEKLDNKNIQHISYTPVSDNVSDIIKRNCIVFTGKRDKLFTIQDVNVLLKYPEVEVVQLDNAGHSLEIDSDYKGSIHILENITDKCADYIKKNMVE